MLDLFTSRDMHGRNELAGKYLLLSKIVGGRGWKSMDEEILEVLKDIRDQLNGITSAIEDVRSEVSNVYLNMESNSDVESKLDDVVKELKKIKNNM